MELRMSYGVMYGTVYEKSTLCQSHLYDVGTTILVCSLYNPTSTYSDDENRRLLDI